MPEPDIRPDGGPPVGVSRTSTLETRTGSWRNQRPEYRDRVAPCNQRCPVGADMEGTLALLGDDRVSEARDLLVRENPMPAITGRVCHHPCEDSCNRRHLDEAVAVHAVERALGDDILEGPLPGPTARTRDEAVAVVGSGPAGLACAYHLARQGYGVTVFEAETEAGGMLRLGIPEYRLPRDVLDRQIRWICSHGIELRTGVRLGPDLRWEALSLYDAVFLATGAHRERRAGFEGEDHPDVRPGLGFLEEVNRGRPPSPGDRVAVVGGGNTAMDCARTALRLGAEPVVVYRRSREEMPAIRQEVEEAEREGVRFIFLAAPTCVASGDDGLQGLECTRMRLGEPDDSGRRRPIPVDDGRFTLLVDSVLTAIGEEPDLDILPDGLGDEGDVLTVGELGETGEVSIFAGGDLTDAPRTVADALGAGKRAAVGIDRHLRRRAGEAPPPTPTDRLRWGPEGTISMTAWRGDDPVRRADPVNEVAGIDRINLNHFRRAPRNPDRYRLGPAVRASFGEVNRGVSADSARAEARRCFNCGVCNDCELCLIFCPDLAISRRPDGGFEVDGEYCKGCGICAAECPRGSITMT